MSYILSALRKADQERKKEKISDVLQSGTEADIAEASVKTGSSTRVYWIGGVALLLALNFWLVDWFQDKEVSVLQTPDDVETMIAVPSNRRAGEEAETVGSPPAQVSVQPQPSRVPERGSQIEQKSDAAVRSARDVVQQQLLVSGKVPTYQQLPAAFRDSLPELQLSGHLFSLAHPQARKVIINGRALREGEIVEDGLSVKEITVDGVVLDYQGTFFSLGAHHMFR